MDSNNDKPERRTVKVYHCEESSGLWQDQGTGLLRCEYPGVRKIDGFESLSGLTAGMQAHDRLVLVVTDLHNPSAKI